MQKVNISTVKNTAIRDMILKAANIAKSDLYGYDPIYDIGELLVQFALVELIEDGGDAEYCAALTLNYKNITSKSVSSTITDNLIYINIGGGSGSGYMGSIASRNEMISIAALSHTNGDWWSIAGNFELNGVVYIVGDEVYWKDGDFVKFGNRDEYAQIIINPSNTSREEDGNWRMRVDGNGNLVMEKRESGSWIVYQTIS